VPHTCRRFIAPYAVLVAREGHYSGKKKSIAFSLDTRGGNAYIRVPCSTTIGLFPPPLIYSLISPDIRAKLLKILLYTLVCIIFGLVLILLIFFI